MFDFLFEMLAVIFGAIFEMVGDWLVEVAMAKAFYAICAGIRSLCGLAEP